MSCSNYVRQSVESISFIIIQATNLCNLNCTYCYLDGRKTPGRISFDTVDVLFKKLSESSYIQKPIKVNWHAGEPLVAGIDFYKEAFKIARKYFSKDEISHLFQTNATLITEEWVRFFIEEDVKIGISCDGPAHIQDLQRVNWAGKGMSKYVQRGIDLLRKHNIRLQGLCVITNNNIDYPNEVYDYFKENQFKNLAFNLEEVEAIHKHTSFTSLSDEEVKNKYNRFLKTFFTRMKADNYVIELREFSYWGSLIQEKSNNSAYKVPRTPFGISTLSFDKEGNIVAFAPELLSGIPENKKEFVVGNIHEIDSLGSIQQDPRYQYQLDAIVEGIKKCEATCSYFDLCGGCFPSNKYYENNTFDSSETKHCKYFVKGNVDSILDWVEAGNSAVNA
jgi:uncharacterized protein